MLLAGCRATGTTRGTGPAVTSPSADGLSPAGTPVAPAASVDPAVGVSTQPVYPVEPPAQGSFEGFATYSYIPAHPTGIIYLFHGSGGSADFAVKIESTDVLNDLIGRGFGYVATESTERSGERRWNVDDPSMTSNPDLARMDRLRRHVLDTTAVDAGTPTYGLGMSNGSAFAALWAAAESSAGVPISGVALYMAGPTKAVDRLGGLRVPTFMVVGVNDTVTDPAKEKADLAAIAHAGIPTELHEVIQRAVIPARYLRVPGVTEATAAAVVAAYRQAGLIDSAGTLVVTLPQSLRGDGADRLTDCINHNTFTGGNTSYVFAGDMNGDSANNNDLIYIPRDQSEMSFASFTSGGKTFTPEAQAQAFDTYINNDPYLSEHRGEYAKRNAVFLPRITRMDLSLVQEVFGSVRGSRQGGQVRLDIPNFGNVLNSDWGVSRSLRQNQILTNAAVDAAGKLTYRMALQNGDLFTTPYRTNAAIADVYVMMLSFRYTFN